VIELLLFSKDTKMAKESERVMRSRSFFRRQKRIIPGLS
jgi:hypothetical protein